MEDFLESFNDLVIQIDPAKEKKQLERAENKRTRIVEIQKRMKEVRHEKQRKKRTKKQQERVEALSKMTIEERKDFISKERTKEVASASEHNIFFDLSFNHLMSSAVIFTF